MNLLLYGKREGGGGNSEWRKNDFLGYQLISEYTVNEFNQKRNLIFKALKIHWNAVSKDLLNIHGDLTHFNILYNEQGKLLFIDKKSINHSKLYDFFYFYSYYKQCTSNCTTLSNSDKKLIINDLRCIIKNICIYESDEKLRMDYSNMNIPEVHALKNTLSSKKDFMSIF